MKSWQKGFDLDYLKSIELLYSEYNKYSASPFGEYNKASIAKDLSEEKLQLIYDDNTGAIVSGRVLQRVKVRTPITMYKDVIIGWRAPGDVVITKLIGTPKEIANILLQNPFSDIWIYTWAEDPRFNKSYMESFGFSYVGGKITTYGEIYSIWFRNTQVVNCSMYGDIPREHPVIDPVELITLKKIGNIDPILIEKVKVKLNQLSPQYAKSGLTSYINKSWTALSLRGYSTDPTKICKPSEMPDKWIEKNGKDYQDELIDTDLYNDFPEVREIIANVFDFPVEFERISFMRLSDKGTLNRHTDQIDQNSGLKIGNKARVHFPIQTNDKVHFIAWEPNGNKLSYNMKPGECWYLDTRKSHMVINESDQERIHLVVDFAVTNETKDLLLR